MNLNPREKFEKMIRADVARMLNVSEPTITKLLQEGMKIQTDDVNRNYFDSREVIDFIVQRGGLDLRGGQTNKEKIAKLNGKPKSEDDEDLEPEIFSDQLERFRKLKGDLAELELAKKKGDLIEKQLHDEFVMQAGEFCRNSFQSIPRKIAVAVAKEKDSMAIEKIIEAEIVGVLKELSEKKI